MKPVPSKLEPDKSSGRAQMHDALRIQGNVCNTDISSGSDYKPQPILRCSREQMRQESETLRITFYEFELEEPFRKGCLNDFVDISTISVANVKQLVGRFCGTYVPIPLLTMKPRMEIIFKANHARSAKGRRGSGVRALFRVDALRHDVGGIRGG
ncbi:suppressor of tumorigenicity 14 protein-like [Tropilaelaps mercedesae]|uniref:Suppressor of tumorigenicity 14 protein-like n=1 Tax=Tropilaelaps mercedesae TaxID=418985 RepID=A0A1V9XIR2_9ACAR|nr:suppressor of tumorigenicity 14 protein-like [Tropilaelaps mercedesae]